MEALILIISCLLLSFVAVLLHLLFPSLQRKPKLNLPPGPPVLPFLGNLHQLGKLSPRSLFWLSREYKPLMHLKLGAIEMLIVSSAEMAEEILKTNDLLFCARPQSVFIRRFSFGHGVAFGSYGESWRHLRKISTLELYTAKRVKSSGLAREEEVRGLLERISKTSAAGQLIHIDDVAASFFCNVICRLVFGKRSSDREFQVQLREAVNLFSAFCPSDFFPHLGFLDRLTGFHRRLEKCFRFFDDLVEEKIEEHLKRKESADEDLTSVFLRSGLSREEIKSIIVEVFMGGSDTSASFIESAMLELIQNPNVMSKAQLEVRRVAGNRSIVEESDLSELVYLKSTVKEILRRRPPAPLLLPHESVKETRIGGYDIPAKTTVIINARAIMMDSSLWKDPEEFRPERFEDNNLQFKGQDFQYIPFSSGRRKCPAISMATVSIELVLANLLHCFIWSLPEGVDQLEIDTREAGGVVLRLQNPLLLRATPR